MGIFLEKEKLVLILKNKKCQHSKNKCIVFSKVTVEYHIHINTCSLVSKYMKYLYILVPRVKIMIHF